MIVSSVLGEIDGHKWRDFYVPHGFTLTDLHVESEASSFAPDAARNVRVIAALEVPIIYTPDSSSGRVRATLPADLENLECLEAWIRAGARERGQLELVEWSVSPEQAPAPYLPSGAPDGPPASWSVRAVFFGLLRQSLDLSWILGVLRLQSRTDRS